MELFDIQQLCTSFPGAEAVETGPPANVLTFKAGGKPFAYFKTSEPEKWRFSVRTTAEWFLELTELPGIKPARYMGRFHWITIVDATTFREDLLQELITWSYQKAFSSLPKKTQKQLMDMSTQ